MSYTGQVSPGGPAQTRTAGGLTITKVAVDPEMSNNCYLLTCTATGEQLLIDAAAEPATLLALLDPSRLGTVVTTHQHWDHHRALAEVVDQTGAVAVAGIPDAPAISRQTGVPIRRPLAHGDELQLGACRLEVIALAGHTPGSVAVRYDDPSGHPHLFTGDSLFPGGPGRTDGPEPFAQLMHDLESRVFGPLPDSTWFYPGHGDDSTLGAERPKLAEWHARGW